MANNYFYYTHQAAQAAAEDFAAKNNGHIARQSMTLDDGCDFDYCDEESVNLCWSGEVSALVVRDNDTYEDVAYFAGWCDANEMCYE